MGDKTYPPLLSIYIYIYTLEKNIPYQKIQPTAEFSSSKIQPTAEFLTKFNSSPTPVSSVGGDEMK